MSPSTHVPSLLSEPQPIFEPLVKISPLSHSVQFGTCLNCKVTPLSPSVVVFVSQHPFYLRSSPLLGSLCRCKVHSHLFLVVFLSHSLAPVSPPSTGASLTVVLRFPSFLTPTASSLPRVVPDRIVSGSSLPGLLPDFLNR